MKRRRPVEAESFGRDELPGWAVRFLERLKPRDRAVLSVDLRSPERAASLGLQPDTLRQARKRIRDRALREFPPEILERVGKVFEGQAWVRRRFGAKVTATPSQRRGERVAPERDHADAATVADCEAGIAEIDRRIATLRTNHKAAFAAKNWPRVRLINRDINRLRRGRKNLVQTLDYLWHPDRLKARGSLFKGRDPYTRKAIR